MLLNYQITQNQPESTLPPLVFIHGLFGSLSNLGMLARAFQEQRTVIQLDVRNHGANYWISRPPILVRGLPLIPIPSRPLKLKKISFYF